MIELAVLLVLSPLGLRFSGSPSLSQFNLPVLCCLPSDFNAADSGSGPALTFLFEFLLGLFARSALCPFLSSTQCEDRDEQSLPGFKVHLPGPALLVQVFSTCPRETGK